MAQMDWNKYPEVMPPADDVYIAVVEFDMRDGNKERSVMPVSFAHDLAEANSWDHDFEGEHRPGWYDTQPDFYNEDYNSFELNVIYWMPYPEAPKD